VVAVATTGYGSGLVLPVLAGPATEVTSAATGITATAAACSTLAFALAVLCGVLPDDRDQVMPRTVGGGLDGP
jgi:hypothetical protein